MFFFLFLFDIYISFVVAATYNSDGSLLDILTNGIKINCNPVKWDFTIIFNENRNVLIIAFVIITIFIAAIIGYSLSEHDLMTGSEYGVSKWGTPEAINKKFASKDEHENRVYSENVRIGMNGNTTKINSNTLVVGGSGTGKSLNLLTPNIYNCSAASRFPGSFVITDPDGGLLRKNGKLLVTKGYRVRTINLISGMMSESDHFNVMQYIRFETDVMKISTAIWDNTQKADAKQGDQFFDNAAKMLLEAIMLLVWLEHDRYGWENNLNQVMDFINMAKVDKDGDSKLTALFQQAIDDTYGEENGGEAHPAWKKYSKAIEGAEETVGSIIQTVHSRMDVFDNAEVRSILKDDNIDLPSIGTGKVDGKENVKTALFLIIPDADTTFNAVAGMIYSLLISELYYQADNVYRGELPVPVSFWFDEFANIVLPENFPKVLATMRKRMMSAVIIIQNMAQIKKIYKENGWENIVGNCDTFIYLGGNEYSTYKYISENIGKKTIWKRNSSVSKGSHGSSSQTDDVMGRELMVPEEVRKLDNNNLIIIVRAQDPVIDMKYQTLSHPDFLLSEELGMYINSQERAKDKDGFIIEVVKSKNPDIVLDMDEEILSEHPELAELEAIVIRNNELDEQEKKINIADINLLELLSREDFVLSPAALEQVTAGIEDGLTDDEIKSYILFDSVEKMKQQRLLLKTIKLRKAQGAY